jgi:hypothetical protein
MTKRERIFQLVAERQELEQRLRDLDAEIDALFGENPRSGRGGGRGKRKEASTRDLPPAAANGHAGSRPSPAGSRIDRVVELAKEGHDTDAIAAKLGVKAQFIRMDLWRARKAGRLPKAEASR